MRKVLSLILVIFSLQAMAQSSSDHELDSMIGLYDSMHDTSTAKLDLCRTISREQYKVDSSMIWASKLIKLSQINNRPYYLAQAYILMGRGFYEKEEYLQSVRYHFMALEIADSMNCKYTRAHVNLYLGDCNTKLSNYDQASSYYFEAMGLFEQLNDTASYNQCLRSLAHNYMYRKLYDYSEEMYLKALAADSARGDNEAVIRDLIGLGRTNIDKYFTFLTQYVTPIIYKARNYMNTAYGMRTKSLATRFDVLYFLAKSIHVDIMAARIMGGDIKPKLDSLVVINDELAVLVDKLDNEKYNWGYALGCLNYYSMSGQFAKAKVIVDSIAPIVNDKILKNREFVSDYYLCSDIYYRSVGDYVNAYTYKSKYYELVNSQMVVDYAVSGAKSLEQDKYSREITQREIREHTFALRVQYIILIMVLAILGVAYTLYRKHKHNIVLNEKNNLLSQKSDEISHKNEIITSSLNYASLIQRAAMPSRNQLVNMFGQNFVIYRPLQIVAGDFLWANSLGKFKMIVCADSTGHGVPGAFVSMLGISLLNEISNVVLDGCESAGVILDLLRKKLMRSLGQNNIDYEPGSGQNKDGIDMALLMIDYENMILHYAGAFRPLWIWRDGQIIKYKANRMPIGMYFGDLQDFTDNVVDISHGDVLYMFSDGISDQFGYVDKEKKVFKSYSLKRLESLLLSIGNLPLLEQKSLIEESLDKWQNGHPQLDDISMVGIKI
ncbi:MAG: SpoIIE family protein phosphatase [Bacteroidales bacterium]|nr:SpoIIE family protein phosphatase [Bacteroidales bacterium]